MRRRAFLAMLGTTAALPLSGRAQPFAGKTYRVGWLTPGASGQQLHLIKAFEDGLRSLGYRLGGDVTIEYRFAEGEIDRVPLLAADLVRLDVDVIVTGNLSAAAVKKAAPMIPIVVPNSADPVSTGLIASLARPGGNVTGFTQDTGSELNSKRLELLIEALPGTKRVGVLLNPRFASNPMRLSTLEEAARMLDLILIPVEVLTASALDEAFRTIRNEQAEGLLVLGDSVVFNTRNQIGAMAMTNRLPAISVGREYAEAGLLLSYGVDFQDLFRRSALVVDKILKGAKPADLPVEQPTKFELVINLKTARTLALKVSNSLIARADDVIE